MNQLIIYYSCSGNTRKIAEDLAKKDSADIFEVLDWIQLLKAKEVRWNPLKI